MVKSSKIRRSNATHGYQLNSKRSGRKKITQKKNKQIKVHSEKAKKLFHPKKSTKTNYQNLKLTYEPNKRIKEEQKQLNREKIPIDMDPPSIPPVCTDELKEILQIPEAALFETRLGNRERWYFKRLYDTYAQNYEAMAKDWKLNTQQLTAKQCEKKILLYLESYKKQCDLKMLNKSHT